MTEAQVRKLLAREIDKAGGLRAFGREHDIDPTYLSRVVNWAPLTPAILHALGLEAVTTYRRRSK